MLRAFTSNLGQAFELVLRRWEAEKDYAYCCDMLKAIRQDLTVQHLADAADGGGSGSRSAFAIEVYESHARLALLNDDLGEFAACQAALVPLHAGVLAAGKRNLAANHPEFVAYRLLHAAALRGTSLGSELHAILSSLDIRDARHPGVQTALQVATALHLEDFSFVLGALPSLHDLGACLLRGRLPRLRERALTVLCKAYTPALPLARVAAYLGFGEQVQACESWLRSIGTVPYATSAGGMELDTKAGLRTLAIRREEELARQAADELAEQRRRTIGPAIPHDLLPDSSW